MSTSRRLLRSSRAARAHLWLTVALGVCEIGLIVAQATLLARMIATVSLDGIWWLAALSVLRGAVSFGFELSGRRGAARVMEELRGALVAHLLRVRPDARRGELAATAVQGVDALEAYFARYLPQVALAALAPPAILAWTLPRDLAATLILAVTFPLIPVFMILIGKQAEKRTRARWQTLTVLSAHFLDVVRGLATLRAHGRAEAQVETIAVAGNAYRRETMKTLRVGFLSALVLELLAMIGVALVAATIGVQLVDGKLTLEAGLCVLLLAPELYLPLRNLGAQFHASADGLAAAERVYEILDLPEAVPAPRHARRCPEPGVEPVVFREVEFGYPGRPVLHDVSFRLEPGETLALVGASGGGKTTIASLLLRLADPAAGGVLCGGVDLREVDPREWRRRIAWLPQRPTIFSASLRENVRLGAPRATDEQVLEALAAANFDVDLSLDTVIGEGGRGLSFGQAQRVALARAFLRDAPLVVLDEPTAHLDGVSERLVAEAVARLCRERTALVIAHRAELARVASRVLELREGRVVDPLSGGAGMSALWRAVLDTRPRWRLALFSVLLGTGAVAAAVALLTLSGYLISRAAERPEILALSTAIVGVRFFGISRAVLRYLERLVSHDLAFRTLTDQRVRFFRRLIPLVPGGLPRSSDVLSRFVADADRLQDLYLRALSPPVVAVLAGSGAVLAAWLILPAGALVVAGVLVAAGVAAPLAIRFTARRAGRRQATARASLTAVMVEIGDGAAELAVFGREADWEERAATASARLSRVARGDALAGGLAVGTAAALTAGAAAAMAAVAIPAVDSGALDSVLLAAIVLLAFASVEAVAPLGAAAASLDAVADAAERLEEITDGPGPAPRGRAVVGSAEAPAKGAAAGLAAPPANGAPAEGATAGLSEPPENSAPAEGGAAGLAAPPAEGAAAGFAAAPAIGAPAKGAPGLAAPPPDGALEVRGVRFRYGERWVLDGVDLRVEPGRAVALVGPSGAGKTTLAELLVRFREPEEGAVLLGGVDVRTLDPEALRAVVRLGGQDAYLFDTTIRANVALAKPDASDEEIVGALERVGLGEWLASLPEGLATPVGEHGAEVSGGQRQRLAAARLLVCDARFLIFDEPTTHLDPAGAEALLRTLVELAHTAGKGVLVITHERDRLGAFDAVVGCG